MLPKDFELLQKTEVFKDIDTQTIKKIFERCGAVEKSYQEGHIIFLDGQSSARTGFILEGRVKIIKQGSQGDTAILSTVKEGGAFSEVVNVLGLNHSPVSVVSDAESRIVLMDLRKILDPSPDLVEASQLLSSNLVMLLAKKSLLLKQKVDVLSKRTIRGKIATYLIHVKKAQPGITLHLNYNREELADFLSVNRSALSRELSKMNQEGIIEFNKNEVRILDLEKLEDAR